MLGFMLVIEFNDGTFESAFGQSMTRVNGRLFVRAKDVPMRTLIYDEYSIRSYSLQPYTASPTRLNGLIIEARR